MNDVCDEAKMPNENTGVGKYLKGWRDALSKVIQLIQKGNSINEIEQFCQKECEKTNDL